MSISGSDRMLHIGGADLVLLRIIMGQALTVEEGKEAWRNEMFCGFCRDVIDVIGVIELMKDKRDPAQER